MMSKNHRRKKEDLHYSYFSPPPGFPDGFFQHRREKNLSKGEICEEEKCPHCLAYKEFMSRQ